MDKKFDLENEFTELEAIDKRLEQGEMTIDEAIDEYRRGTKLAHECAERLSAVREELEENEV